MSIADGLSPTFTYKYSENPHNTLKKENSAQVLILYF